MGVVTRLAGGVIALMLATMPVARAAPTDDPWSATIYYGPSTTKYFGAVLQSFNMHPTGTMVGATIDRNVLYLGYGIHLAAEAEATQYFFGHPDTTYGFGMGFRVNDIFGLNRTDFSIYDGPSYASDPPYTSIGYKGKIFKASRVKFLNYVGAEFAVGLPHAPKWFGVLRMYHRSGMMGVYSNSNDDGMALGLGVQYRF